MQSPNGALGVIKMQIILIFTIAPMQVQKVPGPRHPESSPQDSRR